MDEHNNDPYEQQLCAVFQSCLRAGQTELHEDDWLILCDKLHLTEQSDELKLCIHTQKPGRGSISFAEFRGALLTLLGKTQDKCGHMDSSIDLTNIDVRTCGISLSADLNSVVDLTNTRAGDTELSEDNLKCLWDKLCLKEGDITAIHFVSNFLGIPALPKQIAQYIFEKLDQNCDGLINFDEFLVMFRPKKDASKRLIVNRNNKSSQNLATLDANKCSFDMFTYRSTSNRGNNQGNMWQVAGLTNISPLLPPTTMDATDISLADIATALCEELKSINESLDHAAIQSHIMLLRDILNLYQVELHKMSVRIENMSCEREKLRTDIAEANERVNSLVQELDEQHIREEEVKQTLRKQTEQRYTETIQELSSQLNSEREMNNTSLKSKDEQMQLMQKENHELKNKYVTALKETQELETENESLHIQIDMLKQSNNELVSQVKILTAEHDEEQSVESKQQQEVLYLVDRIKQLQAETVNLRDQNDELAVELETLRARADHTKDLQNDNQSSLMTSIQSDETEGKDAFSIDDDADFDALLKHSTPAHYNNPEPNQGCSQRNSRDLKDFILKQLKNIITSSSSKCSESCALNNELSALIKRLQSTTVEGSSLKQESIKSIASELEAECEERASESLRDLVVPKYKSLVPTKRILLSNSNNDILSESEDAANSQDVKRISTLRDYPPRKDDASFDKSSKEKDVTANCNKCPPIPLKAESFEAKLQQLEIAHAAEKKQLTDQCLKLETSLDALKIVYDESENYWSSKLEEERQLFEQEQKISDEKFSELIGKMAEYEELLAADEAKNGRLSPIEEKFNLEQQYLDLEEEFEKWKTRTHSEIRQKDDEINRLHEQLKSMERPATADAFVQVADDGEIRDSLTFLPLASFGTLSDDQDSLKQHDLKLKKILENSEIPDDFEVLMSINDADGRHGHKVRDVPYTFKEVKGGKTVEATLGQKKIAAKSGAVMKEESDRNDYDLVPNELKLHNLKPINCHCLRNSTQQPVCCVEIGMLQNLSTRLQEQERRKHQLQRFIKQQQRHVEHVLHRIISQHQIEVSDLQCLLRNIQEKLQIQYRTCTEQAEKLARSDLLVKNLYIENACLLANMKRLEQHCHILTGFGIESTSI